MPAPPLPPDRDVINALDGVIIPVWEGDLYMAKACCASIRQFMGNIPITLWVDGDADTAELEQLPNVSRIQLQEVVSPEYAQLLTGSSLSKLPLFWASPYERFLCIDADTVVWGDIRVYAEFDKYDFIASHAIQHRTVEQSQSELERHVFDLAPVARMDPTLEWKGRERAVMGVFLARRGTFSEERLMALARMGCWRCYEQGLLNYLMWRGLQDGAPRIGGHSFQVFPPEASMPRENRFLPHDWKHPVVIHWLGKKPKLGRRYKLMDEYRRLYLDMCANPRGKGIRIFLEDLGVMLGRHRRSLARKFR